MPAYRFYTSDPQYFNVAKSNSNVEWTRLLVKKDWLHAIDNLPCAPKVLCSTAIISGMKRCYNLLASQHPATHWAPPCSLGPRQLHVPARLSQWRCAWVGPSSVFSHLALRLWICRELVAVYTNHSRLGGQSHVSATSPRCTRSFAAERRLLAVGLKPIFEGTPRAMAVCQAGMVKIYTTSVVCLMRSVENSNSIGWDRANLAKVCARGC